MMVAMTAMAVRHARRKRQKRQKRPAQITLTSLMSPAPSSHSHVQSPPLTMSASAEAMSGAADTPNKVYIFGKVSVLDVIMVSFLLGGILVILGLLQLTPGSDASRHCYLLLYFGSTIWITGLILATLRCYVFHWYVRCRHRHHRGDDFPLGISTTNAVLAANVANSTPKSRFCANSSVAITASNGRPRGPEFSPMADRLGCC